MEEVENAQWKNTFLVKKGAIIVMKSEHNESRKFLLDEDLVVFTRKNTISVLTKTNIQENNNE